MYEYRLNNIKLIRVKVKDCFVSSHALKIKVTIYQEIDVFSGKSSLTQHLSTVTAS